MLKNGKAVMRPCERSSWMWRGTTCLRWFFFNNETWSLGCDVQSCDMFEDRFYSVVLIAVSKCNPHGNAEVTNYDCLVSPWNAGSPLNYRIRGLGFAGTSQRAPQYVWSEEIWEPLAKALQGCSSFAAEEQTFQDGVGFALLCPPFSVPFCWH